MVNTSCFVVAGTPLKFSAGLTPPPCASQVNFDGIFSPCLNAGEVSSSADAACAMSSPPRTNASVFMLLLDGGSSQNNPTSYGAPLDCVNVARRGPSPDFCR